MKHVRHLLVAALFAAVLAVPTARSVASEPAVVTCAFDPTTGKSTRTVTHEGDFLVSVTTPGRCPARPTAPSSPVKLVCATSENGTNLKIQRTTTAGQVVTLADVTYPGPKPASCSS